MNFANICFQIVEAARSFKNAFIQNWRKVDLSRLERRSFTRLIIIALLYNTEKRRSSYIPTEVHCDNLTQINISMFDSFYELVHT